MPMSKEQRSAAAKKASATRARKQGKAPARKPAPAGRKVPVLTWNAIGRKNQALELAKRMGRGVTTTITDKRSGGAITYWDTHRPEADPAAVIARARSLRLDHLLQSPRATGARRSRLVAAATQADKAQKAAVKKARAAIKKAMPAAPKAAPKKAKAKKVKTVKSGYTPLTGVPNAIWGKAQMHPQVARARRAMFDAIEKHDRPRVIQLEDKYYRLRDREIRKLLP